MVIQDKTKKKKLIKMKTFFLIMIVGIVFFIGCSDQDTILGPGNNLTSGPNWITLPPRSGFSIESDFSVTKQIDGNKGGRLEINVQYLGGPHGEVRLKAILELPANCFSGSKNITMVLEDVNGTITYSPSMNFNVPAILDLEYRGIDLTGINPDSIDFVYHNPNGNFDSAEYDEIRVNVEDGRLELKDAKIPHFSRYGYSR